jgi:RNA polymerase sigma-70 factor, ECF subfamily
MEKTPLPAKHPSHDIGSNPLMAILLQQDKSINHGSTEERLARTNELLECHQESVYKYAYRLTGSRSAAEDVTQEVFLRVFKSIGQLRDPLAEKAWLMTITRNEFSRWCRLAAAHRGSPMNENIPGCDECSVTGLERDDWVQSALEQLPEEFRTVVLMYYFEELSYAQIAQQLEIPIGTVMSRLSRGKNHLKRCLDQLSIPNPSYVPNPS